MPDLVSKLREMIAKWREQARDRVPPEYADRDMHYKYLKLDNEAAGIDGCADELESLLGLEGQAAPAKWCAKYGGLYDGDYCGMCTCELKRPSTCGPSQPELSPEERHASGLEWAKDNPADAADLIENLPNILPSPSTPIVPGTAGLSAEQVREVIGDPNMKYNQKVADRLNALLGAAKPAEPGVPLIHGRAELDIHDAQIRKSVLEEAAQHVPKLVCSDGPISQNERSSYTIATLGCSCGWTADGVTWEAHIRALAERPAPAGEVKGEK